jgi:hypothetical protein
MWSVFGVLPPRNWADESDAESVTSIEELENEVIPIADNQLIWNDLPEGVGMKVLEFAFGDKRGWPGLGRDQQLIAWYLDGFYMCEFKTQRELYSKRAGYWKTIDASEGQVEDLIMYDNAWAFFNNGDVSWDMSLELARIVPTTRTLVPVPSVWALMPATNEMWKSIARVKGNRVEYVAHWVHSAKQKSVLMLAIKLTLLSMLCDGKIVVAVELSKVTGHTEEIQQEGRCFVMGYACDLIAQTQLDWFTTLWEGGSRMIGLFVGGFTSTTYVALGMVDWWFLLNVFIFCVECCILWALLEFVTRPLRKAGRWCVQQLYLWNGWNLAKQKRVEAVTPEDQVLITDVNGGERSIRIKFPNEGAVRTAEMAMPGSTLCASAKRPLGAIMVANETTELTLVGCFFRYHDFLVTAAHVASQVHIGQADVYLVGTETNHRGTVLLNLKRPVSVDKELFDIDENNFRCETLDVFVKRLPAKMWSALGITMVNVKKPSKYGLTITSAGFVDGVLQAGNGTTRASKTSRCELAHTATTLPGFSGSPIFSGSSVVGVHVAGSKQENTMIRIEAVKHFSPKDESWTTDDSEYRDQYKDEREDMEVRREHDEFVGVSTSGRVKFLTEKELAAAGYDMTDKVRRSDLIGLKPFNANNWGDYDDDEDDYTMYRRKRESLPPQEVVKPEGKFIRVDDRTPVHCGRMPSPNPEVVEYFETILVKLEESGYEQGKYIWPELTPAVEEKSAMKHLELYEKRCEADFAEPNEEELEFAANVILAMMPDNVFEPKVGYKSQANLMDIVNSSLVGAKKSAGRPYQAEGMPTNGDVIKNLTPAGLVELVIARWTDKIDLKLFGKAEANKLKKVKNEMIRIVAGFPLHVMVKNQALFHDMLGVAIENWMTSPVKYAFSPGNPGHCEHLMKYFEGHAVYECDKDTWDFHMFGYIFDVLTRVVLGLARQPEGMSDEEYEEWRTDARNAIEEVSSQETTYVCTSGKAFRAKRKGIMKSGWLLTIFGNSVGQLVPHVIALKRLGHTAVEILSECFKILAGGDDTLQTFPHGYDVQTYVDSMKTVGFSIEIKRHESFIGCEFFSNNFVMRDGVIAFIPVRFTKHIEKLKRVKNEHLAMALSSAMINYCWDKRFEIFDKMYMHLRKKDPLNFPLNLRKSRMLLRFKCKGMECAEECDYQDLDQVIDNLIALEA